MAEALPRYCPRCGTPTRVEMQHCAVCELPVGAMLSRSDNPESQADVQRDSEPEWVAAPVSKISQQEEDATSFAPFSPRSQDSQSNWDTPEEPGHLPQSPPLSPLPPASDAWDAPGNAGSQQPWTAPAQLPPSEPWDAPAPAYPSPDDLATQRAPWEEAETLRQPVPPVRQRKRGGAGRVLFVLAIILVLLAGGGYFAFTRLLHGHLPGGKITQTTIKTTGLKSIVTYAGVTVTMLSVEQSQNFLDDPHTANDGMLRLNLQEQNSTHVLINLDYQQSARLSVQGNPDQAPVYVKSKGSIAPGATQTSTIDFAVTNGGSLSSAIFKLGAMGEAQVLVPLNGQGNLSQYQPKTATQNKSLLYFSLNWTLIASTAGWSLPGKQASTGMEFLTLDFSIDNTLSQLAISGSPYDYLRVKIGKQTLAPTSTDIPVSFKSGETGQKASALFLIPQNSATCTLLLLSQDPGTSGQAKVDFQL